MNRPAAGRSVLAFLVMLVTPLFFATNLIFGRHVISEAAPFTLAMIRWGAVALALAPFVYLSRTAVRRLLVDEARLVFLVAFLGMWVCGGMVYLALRWTTATNATLIFTTAPVLTLLIAAAAERRPVALREAAGSCLALGGIAFIVLRGSPSSVLDLDFNAGDLIIAGASLAWAFYSLLMRRPRLAGMPNTALLSLMAGTGALMLAPVAAMEYVAGAPMPVTAEAWQSVGGIVLFASLLAFLSFQFGIRGLGAPAASVFMYLMPVYGVCLAVFLLGESFEEYHAPGIVMVLSGVVLATLPARRNVAPAGG